MPIRPEQRALYPKDWKAISLRIRTERAGGRCEFCREAINGQPHPVTGSKVVLTVAHLNHHPADCRDENLAAMCQRCHLTYDALLHRENAARTRRGRQPQRDLVDLLTEAPCGQGPIPSHSGAGCVRPSRRDLPRGDRECSPNLIDRSAASGVVGNQTNAGPIQEVQQIESATQIDVPSNDALGAGPTVNGVIRCKLDNSPSLAKASDFVPYGHGVLTVASHGRPGEFPERQIPPFRNDARGARPMRIADAEGGPL